MDSCNPACLLPDTGFARAHGGDPLPSPACIRARNIATGDPRANDRDRPPPLEIPELGLVVKYGNFVKRAELEAQRYVYQHLRGRVPVPEVVGWAEDDGQGFIYMARINAPTLAARWTGLAEAERQAICSELRGMVQAWRGLSQPPGEGVYIGGVGKLPLGDITVTDYKALRGPWLGNDSVQAFQDACGIEISGHVPIVFTHSDLVPCNILVTDGPEPKVAAVIDWAQAGWYPSYWEWCKAKWVDMCPPLGMDEAAQEDWKRRYLPRIVDPLPDLTVYYPWFKFSLGR